MGTRVVPHIINPLLGTHSRAMHLTESSPLQKKKKKANDIYFSYFPQRAYNPDGEISMEQSKTTQ